MDFLKIQTWLTSCLVSILSYSRILKKSSKDLVTFSAKYAISLMKNIKNDYKSAILDFMNTSKWRASCLISFLSYSKIWKWSSKPFVRYSAKHAILAKKNAKNGHKSAILNFFKIPKRRASSSELVFSCCQISNWSH